MQHVGPAELKATLQAAHVLIDQQQTEIVAGSGLAFWLVDLLDDLAQMQGQGNSVGGVSLADVMKLLIQATSLLLVSHAKGMVAMAMLFPM